jgi:sugar/nucleoside kinase (ribokinase family)
MESHGMTCPKIGRTAPDIKAIRDRIGSLPRGLSVVVMPDFFFDHFVHYDRDLHSFVSEMEAVAERGGGNIVGPRQALLRGGNAANFASALASLGIRTHIIGRTSMLGKVLLDHFLGEKGVDLSLLRSDGEIGVTVAIELKHDNRPVNIMVSDSGSVADFSEEHIGADGFEAIRKADCVCVFSWNHMKNGNRVAEKVFAHCKHAGKGIRYLDTGDPTTSPAKARGLIETVLTRSMVDVFSVNENEVSFFTEQMYPGSGDARSELGLTDSIDKARFLHRQLNLELDLHTSDFAFAVGAHEECIVPTYDVTPLRITGAGDSWNAGNVYGLLSGMALSDRLFFANAVAAYYLCDKRGEHGNVLEILRFMWNTPLKKLRTTSSGEWF